MVAKAESYITKPVMKVDVVLPDDYLGDVLEILVRRGKIDSMEARGIHVITAYVPLAKMFDIQNYAQNHKGEGHLRCSLTIMRSPKKFR